MTPYELKKLQVELKRVVVGREEQELKILELMDTIKRIDASIEASVLKEQELEEKLKIAKVE